MFEEMLENAKRRAKETETEEAVMNMIADMMMKSPSLSASRKNALAWLWHQKAFQMPFMNWIAIVL